MDVKLGSTKAVEPGSFNVEAAYYPRVLNSTIHPTVSCFFGLGNSRIASRYAHLHPGVSKSALLQALAYEPRWFRWGGADTFAVTDGRGMRETIVIETNSCPSGSKSIPMMGDSEEDEQGAYRRLVTRAFLDLLRDGAPVLLPPQTAGDAAPAVAASEAIKLWRRDSVESVGSSASASTVAASVAPWHDAPSASHSSSGVLLPSLGAFLTPPDCAAGVSSASTYASSVISCRSASLDEPCEDADGASLVESVRPAPPSPPPATGRTGPSLTDGVLAVIFDKNHMETRSYASAIADATGERVYLAEFYRTDPDPPVRFDQHRRMQVRAPDGAWLPVRAAFRYVTQAPWTRIPLTCATPMLNGILPCLAGGRNKATAAMAYADFNAELASRGRGWEGLRIRTPTTTRDVTKAQVPALVAQLGGKAVVKNPYSNAGQGVYTILNAAELRAFMDEEHAYDKFIVQALVGGAGWSSTTGEGDGTRLYHVGTLPNARGETFVADMRIMVAAGRGGFAPISMYARRAREPLLEDIDGTEGRSFSWGMLGTNLSKKEGVDSFTTESERLLICDRRDFTALGLGLDDLINAYVQTVLAVTAIDRLCCRLVDASGRLDWEAFAAINDDPALLAEVLV